MIRKYIESQLNSTVYCDFSKGYKESGYLTIEIPRYTKQTFDAGKSYNVKLDPDLLQRNNALASNWNKGSVPISDELSIYIEKAMGNMIYVDATRYCPPSSLAPQDMWCGWLPIEDIKIIK